MKNIKSPKRGLITVFSLIKFMIEKPIKFFNYDVTVWYLCVYIHKTIVDIIS